MARRGAVWRGNAGQGLKRVTPLEVIEEISIELAGAALVGWFVFARSYIKRRTAAIAELKQRVAALEARLERMEQL